MNRDLSKVGSYYKLRIRAHKSNDNTPDEE